MRPSRTEAPCRRRDSPMRVVKRYANRKLYDTIDRRYVTLAQIAQRLRGGEDVQILDNASGKDVTAVALSQILTDEERRNSGGIPSSYLADMVRRGSDAVAGVVRRSTEAISQAVDLGQEEVEKRIKGLAAAGELSQRQAARVVEAVRQKAGANRARIEGLIDEAVHAAMARLDIPSRADIEKMRSRLDELQAELEKRKDGPRKKAARHKPAARRATPKSS